MLRTLPAGVHVRRQLIPNVLVLGGEQFSLMFPSQQTVFFPSSAEGTFGRAPHVLQCLQVADLIFTQMSRLHRDLFEGEIISGNSIVIKY